MCLLKPLWRTLIIVVGVHLLAGCAPDNYHTYVIPDDYEGFLVIRYDCPDDQPLYDNRGANVTFSNDGTACVRDSITGGLFFPTIKTHSGVPVHFQTPPYSEASGYAFVDISTRIIRTGHTNPPIREYVFSIMWAGELENLNTLRQSDDFQSEQYNFINENFDIKMDGSLTIIAPDTGASYDNRGAGDVAVASPKHGISGNGSRYMIPHSIAVG